MSRPRPRTIAAQQRDTTPRRPALGGWVEIAGLEPTGLTLPGDIPVLASSDLAPDTFVLTSLGGTTLTMELENVDMRALQLIAGLPRHRNPYDEWLDYPTAYTPRHRAERTSR